MTSKPTKFKPQRSPSDQVFKRLASGWQIKLYKLFPLRTYRILTWSRWGFYVSCDGTPPRPEVYQGAVLNEGFYIIKRKRGD